MVDYYDIINCNLCLQTFLLPMSPAAHIVSIGALLR